METSGWPRCSGFNVTEKLSISLAPKLRKMIATETSQGTRDRHCVCFHCGNHRQIETWRPVFCPNTPPDPLTPPTPTTPPDAGLFGRTGIIRIPSQLQTLQIGQRITVKKSCSKYQEYNTVNIVVHKVIFVCGYWRKCQTVILLLWINIIL